MRIYVLDDEPIALKGTIKTIKEVVPESEIIGFGRARDVFKHSHLDFCTYEFGDY